MADTKTIIATVFQAMTSHKPRLARFLDTDEGESADVRELADQVVKGFPYPVGVELRRLFSSEHQRPDRGRLDQLFKTIERTLQFTAFVMLSQLIEDGQAPADALPGPLGERLLKPGGLTIVTSPFSSTRRGTASARRGWSPSCPRWRRYWTRHFMPSSTSGPRNAMRSATT